MKNSFMGLKDWRWQRVNELENISREIIPF